MPRLMGNSAGRKSRDKKYRPVAPQPAGIHDVKKAAASADLSLLRAEETRPRIADHVAPLVDQRTARPVAARAPDRNGGPISGIGDVARLHGVRRIVRVRDRAADDGAG